MGSQILDFYKLPDTGDKSPDSIAPVTDNEDATQEVFQRPSEALRSRTEILRDAVDELKYLADAERAALFEGGGDVLWNSTTGKFTTTSDLIIRPFLAPASSLPATLALGATGFSFATRTTLNSGNNPLRAYGLFGDATVPGACRFSFTVVSVTGLVAPSLTLGPTEDPRHYVLSVDSAVHSYQDVITYLNGSSTAAVAFRARFALTVPQSGTSTKMPAVARTYFKGALDAEVHKIAAATFTSFFAIAENAMVEGDVLAISYDSMLMESGNGRRQSIDDAAVENNADIPTGSLFLLRRDSSKVAYALPVATVFGGNLIFANGKSYKNGVRGASLEKMGLIETYAEGSITIGAAEASPRAKLIGNASGNSQTKDGALLLYRDGAAAKTLDYNALNALVGGGDANALHTHAVILERWMSDVSTNIVILPGVTDTVVTTRAFATGYAGQIVAFDFNMYVSINANSAIHWEVWVDGIKAGEGDTDVLDQNDDPDAPNLPVNGSVWYAVPTKNASVVALLKMRADSATLTVEDNSRVTIS